MVYVTIKGHEDDCVYRWIGRHFSIKDVDIVERAVRSEDRYDNHGQTVMWRNLLIVYKRPHK